MENGDFPRRNYVWLFTRGYPILNMVIFHGGQSPEGTNWGLPIWREPGTYLDVEGFHKWGDPHLWMVYFSQKTMKMDDT